MIGFHKEFAKVEGPHPQVLIFAARNTECFIDCNRVDRSLICAVSCLQSLGRIVNLENHTVLGCNINALQWLILTTHRVQRSIGLCSSGSPFEIQWCEDCVACMMIKHNGGTANVLGFAYTPESNVFLTAWNESVVIDWAEFYAEDVEFGGLFCCDLRLFTAMDLWDVPNNYHFFVVVVFADCGQPLAIWGERNTFKAWDGHGDHRNTSTCVVIPYSYNWVFALLSWGEHSSMRCHIKAADRRRMPKEKSLLLASFSVHRN